MSSSPTALIYAELLANIRKITVIASLPSPSNKDTKATLSKDGLRLELIHNGDMVHLILPTQVVTVPPLHQPELGSREISWRLSLPSIGLSNSETASGNSAAAPWSATRLTDDCQILCRECGNVLVVGGSIRSWRDLPSENWAEMMDFWHCHKPSIANKGTKNGFEDTQMNEKGYGANKHFKARPGVGFVDLTYFLLSKDDCSKVKSDQTRDKLLRDASLREPVYCEGCNTTVGAVDQLADGIRLYKWSLCLSTPTFQRPTSYPLSHFITAHLLSQISSQAVNKFILHSLESAALDAAALDSKASPSAALSPSMLQVWVFAAYSSISLSKSGTDTAQPFAASKVFYRPISVRESAAILENEGMSVEEVRLPSEVMTEVAHMLQYSTASLPMGARKFREWDIGFMERFVDGH